MKRYNLVRFVLMVLSVIALLWYSYASATDVSVENGVEIQLRYSNLVDFKANSDDTPLVIFFPGSGEASSTQNAISFINNYDLYTELDVNLLVATSNNPGSSDYKDLDKTCEDVLQYVKANYNDNKIIVDAVSLGGHSGFLCADLLQDNGINVIELNIADGAYFIKPKQIQKLAENGCKVNIFASTENRNISNLTRDFIYSLKKEKVSVRSEIFHVGHGKVLAEAIHNNGLHDEYRMR